MIEKYMMRTAERLKDKIRDAKEMNDMSFGFDIGYGFDVIMRIKDEGTCLSKSIELRHNGTLLLYVHYEDEVFTNVVQYDDNITTASESEEDFERLMIETALTQFPQR